MLPLLELAHAQQMVAEVWDQHLPRRLTLAPRLQMLYSRLCASFRWNTIFSTGRAVSSRCRAMQPSPPKLKDSVPNLSLSQMIKLSRTRSLLYRSRFSQPNTHFSALIFSRITQQDLQSFAPLQFQNCSEISSKLSRIFGSNL